MTTPAKLSGAANCITVDGFDLHTIGMIVTSVKNPAPAASASAIQIPGRDGDFDFSKSLGPRSMQISGYIIGDSHAQLMENIDHVNSYFRLKKSGTSFRLIFQDQTDRYWTCRYNGLQVGTLGIWMYSHSAEFLLSVKCLKPYSEATTITTENLFLHCLQSKRITYAGSIRVPLNMEICPRLDFNELEIGKTDLNEDYTKWSYVNAAGSDDTGNNIFGTNCIKATRSVGGTFEAYKSLTLSSVAIDVTKNYVFGAYCYVGSDATHTALQAVSDLHTTSSAFDYTSGWAFAFLKLTTALMTGISTLKFSILNDGTDAAFYIDGCFIYEITAAEAANLTFFPPPYNGEDTPAGLAWRAPTNFEIRLFGGKNIFPVENGGFASTEWLGSTTHIGNFADPFGDTERCFLIYDSANDTTVYSPPFYISGGRIYKITFDYCVKSIISAINIYVKYIVGSGINLGEYLLVNPTVAGSTWSTCQIIKTAPMAAEMAYLEFVVNNAKIYIRNIQVVEETTNNGLYDTYCKPSISKAAYSGTLGAMSLSIGDILVIDNDRMTADLYDFNTNTAKNGMEKLTLDPFFLEPGINTLRYKDDRQSSATPELETCGGVQVKMSYRARYL